MSDYWKKKLEDLNNRGLSNPSNEKNGYWQSKLTELEENNRMREEDSPKVGYWQNKLTELEESVIALENRKKNQTGIKGLSTDNSLNYLGASKSINVANYNTAQLEAAKKKQEGYKKLEEYTAGTGLPVTYPTSGIVTYGVRSNSGNIGEGVNFRNVARAILGVEYPDGDVNPNQLLQAISKKASSASTGTERVQYQSQFDQLLVAAQADVLASTKMDGQNHSVLEEMQALRNVVKGKKERKEAVLKKMEELGIDPDNYALFTNDTNFTAGNTASALGWSMAAGLTGIEAGLTNTLDVTVGNLLDFLGWEDNPVSKLNEHYQDVAAEQAYRANKYKEQAGGGYLWELANETATGVGSGIPYILMSLATMGAGTAASTASLTTNAAYNSGSLLTKAGITASSMAQNPQLWFSFASSLGNDYEELKENGASDIAATFTATLTSLVNAAIEIGFDGGSGIQGLPKDLMSGDRNKIYDFVVSALEEGGEEMLQKFVNELAIKVHNHEAKILDPIEYAREGAVGTLAGAVMGGGQTAVVSGVNAYGQYQANKLTADEQVVLDKLIEEYVSEQEKHGKNLTAKEKANYKKRVESDLRRGFVSAEKIEEILGGDSYGAFKSEFDAFRDGSYKAYKDAEKAEKSLPELQKEYDALHKMKRGDMTGEQIDREAELKEKIEAIKNAPKSADLRLQMEPESARVLELGRKVRDEVSARVKGTRLAESYNELARRNEAYTADPTKYESEAARQTVQGVLDSGLGNGTNEFADKVDMMANLAAKTGKVYKLLTEEQMKEAGYWQEGEGNVTHGLFNAENGEVILNYNDSTRNLYWTIGHETGHVVEDSGFSAPLQEALFNHAIAKEGLDAFNARLKVKEADYKGRTDTTPERELANDLLGEYIFTDYEFISNLAKNERSIAQKILDQLKYYFKLATAGSQQQRDLEKAMHYFQLALEETGNGQKNTTANGGVKQSIAKTSKMDFGEQLKRIEKREMNGSNSLYVGKPSGQLQSAGFSEKPFAMNQGDYRKSRRSEGNNKNYSSHSVPYAFFEKMPQHLASAPMLIDNGTKVTVVTPYEMLDTKGNKSFVIAGVNRDHDMDDGKVNLVKSVYPYDDFASQITRAAESGKLVVINKNKAEQMLATIGVQPSELSRILNLAKGSLSQQTDSVKGKLSYSSIANSFFEDETLSTEEFLSRDYHETEFYKQYTEDCISNMRQTMEGFDESKVDEYRESIRKQLDGIVGVAVAMKRAGYDIRDSMTVDENGEQKAVPLDGIQDSKNRSLFTSLEPNSDYITSHDISTICDKRKNFAEIYDEIVRIEESKGVPVGKRFFDNVSNYFAIHEIMAKKGLTTPCRQCYVESMRKNLAPMASAFIELIKETNPDNTANAQLFHQRGKDMGTIKANNQAIREGVLAAMAEHPEYNLSAGDLTVEMLTTEDGLAQLRIQAPLVYEAFNSFYGQAKPKMPKSATPFRFGELTAMLTDSRGKVKKGLIDKINHTGGFRLQSYSDFQIQNFADVLQVLFEAGTLGLNGHAYTKVPAFLNATEGTNLKRNISIFMYKDGTEWKLDRNDSFPYSLEEIYELVKNDKTGNTSIIAVSQNREMSAWIMANDLVGYGIPFHKSGLAMATVRDTVVRTEDGREVKGYTGTIDHTKQQTEVYKSNVYDEEGKLVSKANTKVKKGIDIYGEAVGWDFENKDNLTRNELIKKNLTAYLDACENAGYRPKFREYVMNNGGVLNDVLRFAKELGFVDENATIDDISFEYKDSDGNVLYRVPYGYYKFLGDFGMFTPDGKAAPQKPLSLEGYDFEKAKEFFSDAESLRRTEILQQFANGKIRDEYRESKMSTEDLENLAARKRTEVAYEALGIEEDIAPVADDIAPVGGKFSMSKVDTDYMNAINSDDMGLVERLVEDAANTAGYETRMFHETDADNIHIFDISRGTHGGTDYQTPYGIFTKTSPKNIGLGSKQMSLFVKAHNTLMVANREDVVNKIPGFAEYYDQITEIDKKYDALANELEDEEFDALMEWMEEHPDADMDEVFPNSYIIENKPADIDSEVYHAAHKKRIDVMDEWKAKYDEVAIQAKSYITNYLRSNGYDSMYFVIDGGSRGRQTDSLIVLDENQVKSADPITYDDNGNVIPLSERFNSEKNDIRYSISKDEDLPGEVRAFHDRWSDFDRTDPLDDFPIREDVAEQTAPTDVAEDIAPMAEDWQESFEAITDEDAPPVMDSPVEETGTVDSRLQKKIDNTQAELDKNRERRAESLTYYDEEIARLEAKYESKKNKESRAAQGILRSIERLKRLQGNIDADYAKRISDLEARVEKMSSPEYRTAEHRKAKMDEHTETWADTIGDTSTWKDLPLGLSYKTKTLRRILRKVVRGADGKPDIKLADRIYDELETKYDHNEALLKRESAKVKEVFEKLKLNGHEDTYAHMLGELRHNPQTELTQDVVDAYYKKHKRSIDTKKVDTAITEARKTFDELIGRVNEVLREQGFKEIPYRQGYFPHFTNPKQTWLHKLFNWKPVNNDIPTDIAGLTEQFDPQRSWQSFNKERKSDTTDYSLYQGLDTYIHGALDWIYHIDDLQSRRALENYIRYIHSEEGIKAKIEEIKANESYDAEEAQREIEAAWKEGRNPLGNFVTELRRRTNTLANKKASGDRKIEEDTNRGIYSTLTNINNRINANMVVGSLSSALTNFIPMVQSWHQVSPVFTVKGLGDYIRSVIRDDGMIEKSDFLTNRLMDEQKLYQTGWDKVADKAALMMNVIDGITSNTVWRSKYLQNMKEGMSEAAAIKDADQFAKNLMAGRSRGNAPTLFDEKNLVTKIFTAFQLEVANQYGYMFEDVPQDSKNVARLVKGYATAFLGAYVYNALYSSLVGRDAAFDPIGIFEELFKDLGWGDDDDDDEEENVGKALLNFGENIIQEIPYVGGLFGGGRIPLSSVLPYDGAGSPIEGIQSMASDIKEGWNEGNWKEGNWKPFAKEMLKPLYYLAMPVGGGQLKKTVDGLSMFDDDLPISGSYTDSGKLRYPVEDTIPNRIQAALFGQYSSKDARYYFDNDIAPLGAEQIQEYQDVDIPIRDYWDYRKGLSGLKTAQEKADYINSLSLSTERKNILINNQLKRKKPIDMKDYDDYGSLEEFDFANENPKKYEFLTSIGVSYEDYKNADDDEKDAYNWAYQYPNKYTVSKAVTSDLMEYKKYTSKLNDIRADKDANGKTINGSAKQKKIDYINSLDIDYGAKLILYRDLYSSDNTYNNQIVEYLLGRKDFSYNEKITILKELGFTVKSDGTVSWN